MVVLLLYLYRLLYQRAVLPDALNRKKGLWTWPVPLHFLVCLFFTCMCVFFFFLTGVSWSAFVIFWISDQKFTGKFAMIWKLSYPVTYSCNCSVKLYCVFVTVNVSCCFVKWVSRLSCLFSGAVWRCISDCFVLCCDSDVQLSARGNEDFHCNVKCILNPSEMTV